MSEMILTCKQLAKGYGGKLALNYVDLSLPRGEIIGLLGPNGSGKTTLIKLAAGILTPTSGEILVAGEKPGVHTKALVSYLPERSYLNDWMSAGQIVDMFHDFYSDFDAVKACEMLDRLGISRRDKLKTMSKGSKEKVQLILVMSRSAQLYLLDEPIGGVDPAARDFILDTIISNYAENSTVVISTHLIADVERVLDRALFISGGKIVINSAVDDIREKEGKSVDALFREVFKC